MNIPMRAEPTGSASAALASWRQPAMALVVCLLFGPIFAAPLVALAWAAAGLVHLTPLGEHILELVALIMAAAPTAWLASRGWRAEGRMAAGLDP